MIKYLFLLLPFISFGQYVENGKLFLRDTVIVLNDSYVQPAREEAKQIKQILILERKVDRLKEITAHKQNLLDKQGELIDTVTTLQAKIDLLEEEKEQLHKELKAESINALELANDEIIKTNKKLDKTKRRNKTLTVLVIVKGVLILILL